MNNRNESPHNKGFTLAETLITLVIVGVVAALTVPNLIAKYHEQETVSRVKKAYSIVTQAWNKYQVDNGCIGKVANCFSSGDSIYNQGPFQEKFLGYFAYVQKIPVNQSLTNIDWLPDKAYNIDGSTITNSNYWMGVTKNPGSSSVTTFFTLADGMIFHFQMPDNNAKSGFMFFDTNGKKGPNRIGKDQFPIGIGAYNNPKYEDKVHPYYSEDSSPTYGLCAVRNNGVCDPDVCTRTSCSPTAYVLKNNKLPPIDW